MVLSVISPPANQAERACQAQLQEYQRASIRQYAGDVPYVLARFETVDDGVLYHSSGSYASEGFGGATLYKTKSVQSALRLGVPLLLADIDLIFTPRFDWKSLTGHARERLSNSSVRFVFQKETLRVCRLLINTGFYTATPSTKALEALSAVRRLAEANRTSEQKAWEMFLWDKYGTQESQCRNPSEFLFRRDDAIIETLPSDEFVNGFTLRQGDAIVKHNAKNCSL